MNLRLLLAVCGFGVIGVLFFNCQSVAGVKKISIHAPVSELRGEVVAFKDEEDSTELLIGTNRLTLTPSVKWLTQSLGGSERTEILVGDQVSLFTHWTIGNRSQSFTVWDKDAQPRLRFVEGAFSSLLLPQGKRYYVKAGAPIDLDNSSPPPPVIATSLILLQGKDNQVLEVKPGEKVELDGWLLYLGRVRSDNPDFPKPIGIAQESASIEFDYILFQK